MSSITSPSFIDDGSSFTQRLLPPDSPNPQPFPRPRDNASCYTGSFIDDGADMLPPPPCTAGFGKLDADFYAQREQDTAHMGIWNEDVKRAVEGDVRRSLSRIGGGGMSVRWQNEDESGDENAEWDKRHVDGRKDKEGVLIPLPPKWGTFVIKGERGRVIIVGEDGEFDSGEINENEGKQRENRWIKAKGLHGSSDASREGKKRNKKGLVLEQTKKLSTIQEARSEEEAMIDELVEESEYSPIGFFMTGGAGGWPASLAPAEGGTDLAVDAWLPSQRSAPSIHSQSHAWPASAASPTKELWSPHISRGRVPSRPLQSEGSESSRHSNRSHTSWPSASRAASVKSHSTYRAPTVQSIADSASESHDWSLKKGQNAAYQAESLGGWDTEGRDGGNSWKESGKVPAETKVHQSTSVKGWGTDGEEDYPSLKSNETIRKAKKRQYQESKVGSISVCEAKDNNPEKSPGVMQKIQVVSWDDAIKAARSGKAPSTTSGKRNEGDNDSWVQGQNKYADSWDGFERDKSSSEKSQDGSGSELGFMPSVARSQNSARSSSLHGRRSKHNGRSEWNGSQTSQRSLTSERACVDDNGWSESESSDGGWGKSNRGSINEASSRGGSLARTSKRAANENQATSNDGWKSSRVSGAPRRTRVAGWE